MSDTGMHLPAWDCLYTTTRLPLSSASITLQTGRPAHLASAFRALRTGKVRVRPNGTPTPSPPQAVPGLGDEALWDAHTLQIRSGGWLLDVVVKRNNAPDRAGSIALARLGLERLGSSRTTP